MVNSTCTVFNGVDSYLSRLAIYYLTDPDVLYSALLSAMADLKTLTSTLQQQVDAYESGNEVQRQALLEVAQQLTRALETPSERIGRMCYLDNYLFVATRVLLDLDIFKSLTDAGRPLAVAELATKCGADQTLLERLIKHVCTQGYVDETGADEYEANAITKLLA